MTNIIATVWNNRFKPHQESVLLFDSISTANEIALMLNGKWDGCNGVIVAQCDEIAVSTAAKLLEAQWCYQGASQAVLNRVTTDEILRRYAIGERNFVNVNLRCAVLTSVKLLGINISYAKLNFANLSQANLSQANLTAADFSQANLSKSDLNKASLIRANFTGANLQEASLQGANLSNANFTEANLTGADFTGANLYLADLRGANFHSCNLSGANLKGAKIIESELAFAKQ
ncbi:pentapeptide repeat-containing protein [Tolypothrix sp. FACHB-123]|uniref:pentapeptide repeat-containing protein n=1 Tax=Tolypothrix sp. FACHB-123 TaxID=2692868 RepID=UPI0016832EAC|nr:pentapeptide repeat-containing protein [Tolypothrix sp. FACHB-123]MBD2356102.1 pentapeptide repeat-containing protein [Tolypothrix sp. FACHB-123]